MIVKCLKNHIWLIHKAFSIANLTLKIDLLNKLMKLMSLLLVLTNSFCWYELSCHLTSLPTIAATVRLSLNTENLIAMIITYKFITKPVLGVKFTVWIFCKCLVACRNIRSTPPTNISFGYLTRQPLSAFLLRFSWSNIKDRSVFFLANTHLHANEFSSFLQT